MTDMVIFIHGTIVTLISFAVTIVLIRSSSDDSPEWTLINGWFRPRSERSRKQRPLRALR